MSDPNPDSPDIEEWLTREDVVNRIGKSTGTVTRLQRAGRLHPVKAQDGTNRYKPSEVAAVMADPMNEEAAERREAYAEFELSTVRAVIGLVKDPREKIDVIQFDIIKDLREDNAKLRAELESKRAEVEAARDGTADRAVAMKMVESETRIKEVAGIRAIETVARLIGNAPQIQFSREQLVTMIQEDGFLTPEQLIAAKKAVISAKPGPTPEVKPEPKPAVDVKPEEPKAAE